MSVYDEVDTLGGIALATKIALDAPRTGSHAGTRTHCPYCAFQCGMVIDGARGDDTAIIGDDTFPVNKGALCIKGWTAASTLKHPDRLLAPLMRGGDGTLAPASWDAVFNRIVSEFRRAQNLYGADSVGVFGGGSLTNEKSYLLGKFARVALGTSNIDYNGRFCMSSAAAASIRSFGIDRGLPFPVADIANSETILLVGRRRRYYDEPRRPRHYAQSSIRPAGRRPRRYERHLRTRKAA